MAREKANLGNALVSNSVIFTMAYNADWLITKQSFDI